MWMSANRRKDSVKIMDFARDPHTAVAYSAAFTSRNDAVTMSVDFKSATEKAEHTASATTPVHKDFWAGLPPTLVGTPVIVAAISIVGVATCVGAGLSHWLPQQSIALVYVLAVVLGAVGFGVVTGLAISVLSFLAYNFFFIPPVFTFTIADPNELFALVIFFAVALLTGSLAGRMREVADAATRKATTLQGLNDFAGTLSATITTPAILLELSKQAGSTIRGEAIVLIADADELRIVGAGSPGDNFNPVDWQAARRAYRSAQTVYASRPGFDGAKYEFQPIIGRTSTLGVVGLAPADGRRSLEPDDEAAVQTILRHAAIALDRTRLEQETAAARDDAERERLRSALLSSLSHDLRTPLASILGAVTSLRELGTSMSPETRDDLLVAIEEETARLSRFVVNLLDMTRLEVHDIDLTRDWLDVSDIAQIAVSRARRMSPNASVTLLVSAGLPAVRGDAALFEHVVFNLLDNAIKFSGAEKVIAVAVSIVDDDRLELTVSDRGCGVPKEALVRIFETFYRVRDTDAPGTGLGLAICKRIVDGMGGTIHAVSPVNGNGNGGTRIVVRLPIPRHAKDTLGDEEKGRP